jgi:CheY-like chemotaxis protein
VYFPHAESVARRAGSGSDAAEAPGFRGTIMVVEDEDDVRQVLADVLTRSGYGVLEAKHGPDALSLAEQHAGRIDLVIIDMVMPQMDGWEVARRMAILRPEAKVLFISGYSEDVSLARGLSTSEVAFLGKPFTPTALRLKVRTVLAGSDAPGSAASQHAG